jgi:hypothetical protein
MVPKRLTTILTELKAHAPFTLFGAFTGILLMLVFRDAEHGTSQRLFSIFHPAHVVLSAMVTASLFKLHERAKNFLWVLLVGYVGSIGIATLSDCIIPFLGESILGVAVPSHAAVHHHPGASDGVDEHDDPEADDRAQDGQYKHRIHLGFIEDWYLVNPAAILGVLIAYFWPKTKFPHAGHVLLSTWASSFHVLMNTHKDITAVMLTGIFIVLFIAVWLPCCISDIVFPLLFVKSAEAGQHGHG